jgi:hypothetical protein
VVRFARTRSQLLPISALLLSLLLPNVAAAVELRDAELGNPSSSNPGSDTDRSRRMSCGSRSCRQGGPRSGP